jgi:hypothetical protein
MEACLEQWVERSGHFGGKFQDNITRDCEKSRDHGQGAAALVNADQINTQHAPLQPLKSTLHH